MNLANVMKAVAAQLATIADLNVYSFPPDKVEPPAAVVSYPDDYTFDATYGRGADKLTLPVVLVVGKVDQESTRDALGAYVDGSGARSIKAVVEAGVYTAFGTVRVAGVEFDVVTVAGVDLMAALFSFDIAGSGNT